MALEFVHASGPQPLERGEPDGHFFQWLRFQPINAALRVNSRFYETSFAKHPQML
jgi:hypothetical protein